MRQRNRKVWRHTLLGLACLVQATQGHELAENRATLILRDKSHLSITLYINYTDALYRALAATEKYEAFLVKYASLAPEEFQRELQRAQARFQKATHILLKDGNELPLSNWQWPPATQVQSTLRVLMMQAMVDAAAHSHAQPLEIHAEANAGHELRALTTQFPPEFQRVLVVYYQPGQVWVEAGSKSPPISFPPAPEK